VQPGRRNGGTCCVGAEADRRRALARLALLGVSIGVAFLAVSLAGTGPSDAQRWVAGAGLAGPVVFVLVGGALGPRGRRWQSWRAGCFAHVPRLPLPEAVQSVPQGLSMTKRQVPSA